MSVMYDDGPENHGRILSRAKALSARRTVALVGDDDDAERISHERALVDLRCSDA